MGIDFGSKRIGLAFSDDNAQFAIPHNVIPNNSSAINEIVELAKLNKVTEIVMGESRDYKGVGNAILIASLEFKKKLEEKGFMVYLEPEFMTSVQAERFQGKNEMTDASAGALILQSFLDKRAQMK